MEAIEFVWEDGADRTVGLPSYETADAVGADLRANLPGGADMILGGGKWELVPTGLRAAIPRGFEAQLRPRSGLALKHGVTLLNSPGTIDSDYRGPIGVILLNASRENFRIAHGMRICQMVVARAIQVRFEAVERLDETERGAGGFGSTGLA